MVFSNEDLSEVAKITKEQKPKAGKGLRVSPSSGVMADYGGYSSEEDIKNSLRGIRSVEFPEILRIAKEVSGSTPLVRNMTGKYLGNFSYKEAGKPGVIKLRADIFKDPVLVAKVLAHELGHATDYIPDRTMARGNLVGRIYTLNKFMSQVFGDVEGEESTEDKVFRTELKALTQIWKPFDENDVSANYLKYRYSSEELYADSISVLFNDPDLLKNTAPNFWKEFFANLDKKSVFKENFFAIKIS